MIDPIIFGFQLWSHPGVWPCQQEKGTYGQTKIGLKTGKSARKITPRKAHFRGIFFADNRNFDGQTKIGFENRLENRQEIGMDYGP
eukprot:scaffold2068_cov96-Cylindrotheca_fusiformis.AAC.17